MFYKKFTQDIGILGLTQLVVAIGGVITLPIITKFLGAEDYGIWTQLMVTSNLIAPIALLGLPYTMARFLAGEKEKERIQDGIWSTTTLITGATATISLFLILFSAPISRFFDCPALFVQILAI